MTLVASDKLASLAEAALHGEAVADADIAAEIAPAFVDDGARTDTAVLACTHYPLILDRLERLAPWPVTWIDPAPAIARRASSLIGAPGAPAGLPIEAYFTSGKPPSAALAASLGRFGVSSSVTPAIV